MNFPAMNFLLLELFHLISKKYNTARESIFCHSGVNNSIIVIIKVFNV